MDYSRFFSDDVPSFLASPVREIFRKVDLSAICSFAGGYPAADTFPVAQLPALTANVLEKYGTKALQYGATQGVPELRSALAKRYGVPVSQVQITTSSQQGIDVCTRILVNPGDIVLADNPVYLGALQSFLAYRAKVMSVAEYLALDDAEKPKFLYVIPDFNNPTGVTLSLEERMELVRVARELDILIVEDSPYREVRYEGEPLPTIQSLAPERTIFLGSFSKIFAPGFRLGWMIGPEAVLEKVYLCKQCLDLCPPTPDQYITLEFLTSGALDENLRHTVDLYRRRRDRMVALLEQYMPEGVSWTYPSGGLFLWLTLPESIDSVALYDEALARGVAYVAGSFFYTDGSHRNTMRLNYTFIDEAKMEPGIRLLGELLRGALNRPKLFRFSGAGNDFVVLDGRKGDVERFREAPVIGELCRKYHTDGLMILGEAPGVDFSMEFFNPDGSGGMMCGNGGRCITAFASLCGIQPARGHRYHFLAPDGLHNAEILEAPEQETGLPEDLPEGDTVSLPRWTVRLKMIDAEWIRPSKDGWFLNTGTWHLVRFVSHLNELDMEVCAKPFRWDAEYQPDGTNVDLVQVTPDGLHVRTYEKGVEGETLACGTGITASALAAWHAGIAPDAQNGPRVSYRLQCRRGDWLSVDFTPDGSRFTDVYLTGPAELTAILCL